MLETPRTCSKPGCVRRPRADGSYCKPCFAHANRVSHHLHRRERNARRRERAEERDEAARAADSARAKLAVAIARDTIDKGPCVVCHVRNVTAYIADPSEWRDVLWVCRAHRADEVARRTTPPEIDPAIAWQAEREVALTAIASLPDVERDRLFAIAARGPVGIRLSPNAPLFMIQLVHAYHASRTLPRA